MTENVVANIIAKFGSQQAVADAAGVTQPSVAGWLAAGHVPARRQQQLIDAARRQRIELGPADFFAAAPKVERTRGAAA